MFIKRLVLFLSFSFFLYSNSSLAGSFLLTPMLGLSNASYQPVALEKTPNYYGPEIACLMTYHGKGFWENGILLSYFSGVHPAKEKPKMSMSTLALYSGVFKIKVISFGLIAGYSLLSRLGESTLIDPVSTSQGSTFGLSLGAVKKGKSSRSWRISLDYLQSNLSLAGSSIPALSSSRKLDKFQIRLGYTYM